MPEFIVRALIMEDADDYRGLNELRHAALRAPLGLRRAGGAFDYDEAYETMHLAAVDSENRFVGCATLILRDPHASLSDAKLDGPSVELRAMAIDPGWREKGVGRAILDEVNERADGRNLPLWSHVRPADVPLHIECGWEKMGDKFVLYVDHGWNAIGAGSVPQDMRSHILNMGPHVLMRRPAFAHTAWRQVALALKARTSALFQIDRFLSLLSLFANHYDEIVGENIFLLTGRSISDYQELLAKLRRREPLDKRNWGMIHSVLGILLSGPALNLPEVTRRTGVTHSEIGMLWEEFKSLGPSPWSDGID